MINRQTLLSQPLRFGLPSDPEHAVVTVVWWLTLIITAWWIAGVLLWWLSRRSGSPLLLRLGAAITSASSRRLAETMLAVSLVGAGCSLDGGEQAPVMRMIEPVDDEVAAAVTVPPTTVPPTTAPPTTVPPTTVAPTTVPPTTAPSTTLAITASAPTTTPSATALSPSTSGRDDSDPAPVTLADPSPEHEVVAGDNLWSIAVATVTDRGEPTPRAVAAYWTKLVELNRARLDSGDPCLIFPGELIELPPAD